MAPFSFIGGVTIKVIRKYRPSNILGWLLTVIGFGLMSLLKADSTTGQWVGYQFISAAGTGLIVSVYFLCPLWQTFEYHDYSSQQPCSQFWHLYPWNLLRQQLHSCISFVHSPRCVQFRDATYQSHLYLSRWFFRRGVSPLRVQSCKTSSRRNSPRPIWLNSLQVQKSHTHWSHKSTHSQNHSKQKSE